MCNVFGLIIEIGDETWLTDEETVSVVVRKHILSHCHVFGSQRVIVVNVVEVVRIFQIHLQDVPVGSVAVDGIDVEIFGVVEKTKFSYGEGSERA